MVADPKDGHEDGPLAPDAATAPPASVRAVHEALRRDARGAEALRQVRLAGELAAVERRVDLLERRARQACVTALMGLLGLVLGLAGAKLLVGG